MSNKNFTIYKSSAGSGKTFTLVKEYLALALSDEANPPKSYRHILAITFTNKAASEMKERIIKALKEIAEGNYKSISTNEKTFLAPKEHKRLNALQVLGDKIISQRAENILIGILHNYSDFAIGTIDSFIHKIVRTFAFDLKIPMSFELEMDDDKLLTQAVDLLIAQIGNDERLTKALVEFTESKTDDEKSWHIENDLKYFAKNLLNEEGTVHIDKLRLLSLDDFFKIKDTLSAEINKFEKAVSKEAEKAIEIIKNAGLVNKDFFQGDKGIAGYFEKLAKRNIKSINPNSYTQTSVGEDKWYTEKTNEKTKATIENIKSQLLDCFNSIDVLKDADYSEYILFTLINSTIYSLAVLNEIEKLLNEYKAQNNILHISEFNKMIAKIVLNEPIPFIYERLGEKYNNYLIDEFQDTSVLQFQNLLPLIDNSLSGGHFTMLVGDGKQAIYRWRGGEVEQFAMLPEVFAHNNNPLVLEREEALKRNHNPQVLDKNYRSNQKIVEFNNSIFKILSDKLNDKYKSIYETLEQGFKPENTGGYVQVEFLQGEKEELREQNLERTYLLIKDLLQHSFQLKDVAILVRKNTDGSEVANYLSKKGIEVISSDSLLLSNSAEVNFIYSLLRYLNNTSDEITQAELLEYLVASKRIENTDINQLLVENREKKFISIIQKICKEFSVVALSKMALYELCEELIRLFKLNKKPNAYIQFFLDEVLNYSIKQNNNLKDFIEYWEEKKEKSSLSTPQGMNAVTIMTIHRAKGLEFPVVILPFSNGRVEKGKKHLWVDVENEKIPELTSALVSASEALKDTPYADLYEDEKNKSLLDSLNVLYVALTRPEERLYILTGKPSKTPEKLSSVSDMFAHYYQMNGEWKEEKTVYTFGEENKKQEARNKKQEATNNNFQLLTFNSNQWRDNIKMRAAAPSIWNLEITASKKDFGVMLHTAMAKIKTADDVELSINSMFSQGLITLDEKRDLLITIKNIIELPKLKNHFIHGLSVKNEAEIITQMGEVFRPDRVVLNQKNVVIIDYKTGEEQPKHKQQILEYADLLNQMGYTVTEKLLVYIENKKVVEC
jgi:ATP-dependent exoDNAse (exonuclease V) beta subunit